MATIIEQLSQSGLRVVTSFDSGHARRMARPVLCPHHRTGECDCQLAILLVYERDNPPATLLAHGQNGETWVSLANGPGQQPPLNLEKKIGQALVLIPAVKTRAT